MGWFTGTKSQDPPASPAPPCSGTSEHRKRPVPERLSSLSFDRFVREHPQVVVDVWATWCVPCRAFAPVFAEAAGRWGEAVCFAKLQADHEPTLVSRLGIRSIPSLLFFREGRLVRTETGSIPFDELDRLLHRTFRALP